MIRQFKLLSALTALSAYILVSCDKPPKTALLERPVTRKFATATTLTGSVSKNSGPIKTGELVVKDESGHVITHAPVRDGHFNVEIPANTSLPVLLTLAPSTTGETLMAAVIYETVTKYYVNPTSTAIANRAKALGGYTRANLDRAAEDAVHIPDSNKTTAGWRGDPTKQYGGWH